jgi:colicin import membrane protein
MNETAETPQNALTIINQGNVAQYFVEKGLDPIIERIRKEVKSFVPDISTDKGRKEIASMARKVASSKVALDDLGKDLVSGIKKQATAVDAERKRMRDTLDALRDETRAPLTAWEERDANRMAGHKDALTTLQELVDLPLEVSAAEVQSRLETLATFKDRDFEEFTAMADVAWANAGETLNAKLAYIEKAEKDRIELERLQKAEAERMKKEWEDKIAAEAKALAEAEAEKKAQVEREAAAKREADIQREKEEALAAAKKADEERIASEERAKAEARTAEERAAREAIAAKERASKEAEEAVARERERAAAEERVKAEETAKREADKKHRAKINNEASQELMLIIRNIETCRAVVTAIAQGKIPNVKISY